MKYYITLSLLYISIFAFVLNTSPAISDDGPSKSFGIIGSANLPQCDLTDMNQLKTSLGFMAFMNYAIAANIMLNAYIGYINWSFENSHMADAYTYSFIPFLVAASYYFMIPETRLYLLAGMGLGPFLIFDKFSYGNISESNNETKFGISPFIGAYYKLSAMIFLTLQTSYPIIFAEQRNLTYLSIAVGLAISFNLFSKYAE